MVCFPGAKIEVITERVEKLVGLGDSILVHIGTNKRRDGGYNCHIYEIQAVS